MLRPMRSLGLALAVLLSACAEHHLARDGAIDAAPPAADARMSAPDAGAWDAGPECTCRSGAYRVYGEGSGYTIDYDLVVRECDGVLSCTLRGARRRCYDEGSSFRVHLDADGYTQLIFQETPCSAPWPGRYATHGGVASVLATRVEE